MAAGEWGDGRGSRAAGPIVRDAPPRGFGRGGRWLTKRERSLRAKAPSDRGEALRACRWQRKTPKV